MPVPQPLNILWAIFYDLPDLLISQLRRACKWRAPPKSIQPGFKLVPDKDKQSEIERSECEALKRALAARKVREDSEVDAKVAVVGAQVKKLEDSNHKRFEELHMKRKLQTLVGMQTQEIELLREELDRLRRRTFPTFTHYEQARAL